MSDVIGMFKGNRQQEMVDVFRTRRFEDVLAMFGWGLCLGLVSWGVAKATRSVY